MTNDKKKKETKRVSTASLVKTFAGRSFHHSEFYVPQGRDTRATYAAIVGGCYGDEPYMPVGLAKTRIRNSRFRTLRSAENYLEKFAGYLTRFLTDAALVSLPDTDPERKSARSAYQEMIQIYRVYQEPAMKTILGGLEKRFPYLIKLAG